MALCFLAALCQLRSDVLLMVAKKSQWPIARTAYGKPEVNRLNGVAVEELDRQCHTAGKTLSA
eukprot:5292593-Karenia_brevis.AAC.2